MCGIVGYNGVKQASNILLDSLSKLEYRGYDSAGIAVSSDNEIKIVKEKGKLSNLVDKINDNPVNGTVGIGHTRWATHGEPSEVNAHPHRSNDELVTLVHNGIIENYQELKTKLEKKKYKFVSTTDTEVVANLIEYYYKKYKLGPVDAIAKTMVRVRGTYALAIIFKDYPDEIWVARKDSPLIIGTSLEGNYIASDVPAILKYTNQVYYIDNLEMACIKKNSVSFYDLNGDLVDKQLKVVDFNVQSAEKDGYEHFMIKEIHEQPSVITRTINSLVNNNKINLEASNIDVSTLKKCQEIYIIACGSAYHVGVCLQYIIEDLARVHVRVELASEFRYRNPILKDNSLAIIISQSGETADSLAALRLCKENNIKTLSIVNVLGSSIARESDYVIYTKAGPEIAVATTKAYSTQLIAGYLFAVELAKTKNTIDDIKYLELINEIKNIPDKVQQTIDNNLEEIQKIASTHFNIKNAFFIGRCLDYAVSLEGSLKLKEVSYIHSEAYAAGELKHGTISLIEDNTLVIGLLTQDKLYEKTLSNIVEVKSRGANVIAVTTEDKKNNNVFNDTIIIPKTISYFYPSLAVIPLQLFSYYVTISKGYDVDKPRNLAKSVTVE